MITPVTHHDTGYSLRKRGRSPSFFEEDTPLKIQETALKSQEVNRCMAMVTFDSNYTRGTNNFAYLTPNLYDNVFGEEAEEGGFIKVANLVMRAFRVLQHSEYQMDLNYVSYRQISSKIITFNNTEHIWISKFDFYVEQPGIIREMRLRVYPAGPLNSTEDPGKARPILESSLQNIVKESFVGEILRLDQELFINHPTVGPLNVSVERWEQNLSSPSSLLDEESLPYYGEFSTETKLSFVTGKRNELVIVEEMEPERIQRFYFTTTKVTSAAETVFTSNNGGSSSSDWKKQAQPLPLTIPFSELSHDIREVFKDKLLSLGHEERFQKENWYYNVQLTKVTVNPSNDELIDNDTDSAADNLKIFRFQYDHDLTVNPGSNVIFTQNFDNPRLAQELTFKIIDFEKDNALKQNEVAWVSAKDLSREIKKVKPYLAHGSKIVITVGDDKYLMKLVREKGDQPKEKYEISSEVEDIWVVHNNTRINFYTKNTELKIVDTSKASKAETIRVKVSLSGKPLGGFFALFGSEANDSGNKTVIEEEELEKIFRDSISDIDIVHKNQRIKALSAKGENINFTLEDVKTKKQKKSNTPSLGEVYTILDETKIKFECEKDTDLLISSKSAEITLKDIDQKLVEFGIGGMKDEFKDIISRTILSRTTYQSHIEAMDQQPSRGLLLYGPPGTGKTLLARKLGEILGVTKERIQLLTGSQVWNKWVGGSEKNVRKIFENAREDQKRLGDKSPLHLIIIDEIDAFLQKRTSDARRYETSVVNTFLAELDGISSNGADSLKNVIVVGLTNHPDRLDEAVKRPGRLYPSVHIGIPNMEGRKEIFDIHTKKIRKMKLLASDVDSAKIAELTVGRTGAFIEGMVTAAVEFSLKRLWENDVSEKKIKSHPLAKLTMADFEKAFEECIKDKSKSEQKGSRFVPDSSINLQAITSDLFKLRLGGISQEALKFLYDLKVAQHYRQFLYNMKHPFPKGVLLYGPPGTGKTRLAKSIKKLFELDDQRYTYLKASELWPLRGEGMKEKIEEIIKPVKAAAADLKEEAPLHVIVVDELDMMFLHKKETDTPDSSVMNQFLMELEPLFEEGTQEIHNLLVIGIAHRGPLGIPEGIIRHARLGKHVEMKPPNLEGRKEIFNIYLKEYVEKDFLDKSIDFNTLAEMTKDYNGAYIEGLVSQAISFSLRRTIEANVPPASLDTEPLAKLKMEDFESAHNEMKMDEKWKDQYI